MSLQAPKKCATVEEDEPGCSYAHTVNPQLKPQQTLQWAQGAALPIRSIWGRLVSKMAHKDMNDHAGNHHYLDLTTQGVTLGTSSACNIVITNDNLRKDVLAKVCSKHLIIKREAHHLSPAVLVDCSLNGTFVNGIKVGQGKCRVLNDDDEVSIINPLIKLLVFKDQMKNEQSKLPLEVSRKYFISKTLGWGSTSVVKLAYKKENCTRYAIKIMKNGLPGTKEANMKNEVLILKQVKHPFIISTEEFFERKNVVCIVMELMEGGNMFDHVFNRRELTEQELKVVFRQIVLAVQYLHSRGITHRDLKLENLLIKVQGNEMVVKIADFGLSKLAGAGVMKTKCGTMAYAAPEIVTTSVVELYGPEIDVWSLGVIFYVCVFGIFPFSSDYPGGSLRKQIQAGRFRKPSKYYTSLSPHGRKLMKCMLTVKAEKRITLKQILNHLWMKDPEVIKRVDQLMSGSPIPTLPIVVSSSSNEENQLRPANKNLKESPIKIRRLLNPDF